MNFFQLLKENICIALKYLHLMPKDGIEKTNVVHIARYATNRTRAGAVKHINKMQAQRQRVVRVRRMSQKNN